MRTKEILFKLDLQGNGIVNFDDTAQKYFLAKYCHWQENYKNNNLKFSKKTFRKEGKDEDGNDIVKYNMKIDSTCLRHALFERDCKISNPKVAMNDELFAYYVSSVPGLVRGYMFTTKEDIGYARSSAITITSAEETSGAIPYMEVHSNYCADGTSIREDDEKKKTSFYYSENVGDTFYNAKGAIDLTKLQFMSCDPQFGRVCFKDKWMEGDNNLLEKVFKEHYGRVPYEVGHYNTNTNTYKSEFSEHGIKFDEDFVRYLLKEILIRVATLNIKRSMGYANACRLQCKAVTDGFSTFDDNGWVDIKSEEDIDNFISQIEIEDVYVKTE